MLMAEAFATYLPPVYPYNVIGGQRQIKQMDFSQEIDIIPVADPNIFSQTQRIAMAQTTMQMAQVKSLRCTTCTRFTETCTRR